jgi:hypothetical protein
MSNRRNEASYREGEPPRCSHHVKANDVVPSTERRFTDSPHSLQECREQDSDSLHWPSKSENGQQQAVPTESSSPNGEQ